MDHFRVVDALDPERWDRFVAGHPKGSIFHTSAMVDVFRATKHHYPLALAALDPSREVLALLVSVRVQTLPDPLGPLSSRAIFYAEPLCRPDAAGEAALAALLAAHDARMRTKVLFAEVRPLGAPAVERPALQRQGYAYEDYLNFLIDLRQPTEQLWRNMRKSCRSDIRRNQKRGMRVEEVPTAQGVDLLYQLLQLSYERAKVPLADKSLFTAAFQILHPREMLKIFVAYHAGRPVAADVMLLYKKTVYAWYGGVERVPSIAPAECLTWHELEWGQQHAYEVYDFGGAGWPDKPYGVRDFKAKFGGQLVNYGRYRKVYAPWKLALAERAYGLARNVVNPKNWTPL